MESCCADEKKGCQSSGCTAGGLSEGGLTPDFPLAGSNPPSCCGVPSPPTDVPDEIPGYRRWEFVKDILPTPAGPVPRVSTRLSRADRLGTMAARIGVGRDSYRIAPGIYAVGEPDDGSPVLVTANYKLTFDTLRVHLDDIDAWVLVVETHGINVWCAAGKGSFSTREVATRVASSGIAGLVSHRRLILPQLCATGVAAREVKRLCGFEAVWGPVHARDIKDFLDAAMKATADMRKVSFSLGERVALIPVELNHLGKPTLYLVPVLFLLSGIGTGIFSLDMALTRGFSALLAYLAAVITGAMLTPALLPWLPGRAFAIKGAGVGAAAGAILSAGLAGRLEPLEMLALTLFITALSSFLAMNFTGSTPFTSPTGVEKEMRRAIPAQAVGTLVAVILWIGAGFMGG